MTDISIILKAVRTLKDVKTDLEKTHRLEIESINKAILKVQDLCPHTNGGMTGWEGGRYYYCPDCGYSN